MTPPLAEPRPIAEPRIRRLPPERLLWALLAPEPVRALGPRRRDPAALGMLLESHMPLPAEAVHAAYLPLPSGAVLACAIPTDDLRAMLDDNAEILAPAALPGWIAGTLGDAAPDPIRLNLRTGPFEPPAVARLRRRWSILILVLAAAGSALLIAGGERRVARAERAAAHAAQLAQGVYAQVLPPTASPGLPPPARLTAELRRARQLASDAPGDALIPADAPLAELLAAWPNDLELRVELLSASAAPDGLSGTIVAEAPSAEAAQTLVDALSAAPPWRITRQDVSRTRDAVRIRLTLHRPPTALPPPPGAIAADNSGGRP